jgi:hypothetical protein
MATRLRCVLTNAHTHTRTTPSLFCLRPSGFDCHPFHITPSRLDTQALWWVACACFPLPETLSYIQSPRGPAGSPSPVAHTHTRTCWIGVTLVTHSIGGDALPYERCHHTDAGHRSLTVSVSMSLLVAGLHVCARACVWEDSAVKGDGGCMCAYG